MTTITDPAVDETAADTTESEDGGLVWISVHDLIPNPDNPRKDPGDLTELERSIRSRGILVNLTCLPADEDGKYMLVCGHRRTAASERAAQTVPEREFVPVVVQQMSRLAALDAMVIENMSHEALSTSEQISAIEAVMSLDAGCTPARLCRRMGRSQAWVRSRMSLAVLRPRWREAIDAGRLSVTEAEAIASAADLGPEHIEALCEQMADRHNGDPVRAVERYLDNLRIDAEYEAVLAEQRKSRHPVFTANEPAPEKHRPLSALFGGKEIKVHASEPCQAVVVKRPAPFLVGGPVTVEPICTQPRRHSATRTSSGKGNGLTSERGTSRARSSDDSAAKRRGRVARLAHAKEVFGRAPGGLSSRDLTEAALRALVEQAGADPLAFAATILGYEEPRNVRASTLLDQADTPAALIRMAGAVAFGLAENQMYWSPKACGDYLRAPTGTGWEPDEWRPSRPPRRWAAPGPALRQSHPPVARPSNGEGAGPPVLRDVLRDLCREHLRDLDVPADRA